MTREQLKAAYRAEDARRILEPTFLTNTSRVRQKLKNLLPGQIVKLQCFNDVEAEIVKEDLTPDEAKRVIFSWIFRV
jgi:hypothetical protein